MKKYLLFGLLAALLAVSASEAENSKIKLPDGLYIYDSWISHTEGESVRFEKFFVVQNNIIYSSQEAMRKFGASTLNSLFTKDKNYKILFGGGKIGEIHNVKIDDERDWDYKEELSTKNLKEGPAYGRKSVLLGRLGSAIKCFAVPEEYKAIKKKVYTEIPQEEVDKIAKLAKEKLPLLLKNSVCKILHEENFEVLDKISDYNGELYIGLYRLVLKRAHGNNWGYCDNQIIFSIKNQNVHFITSRQSEDWMTICGMLDVDGDGGEELIIEKTVGGEDGSTTTTEIYKQKADGNWILVPNCINKRIYF